jgi:HEAT repeat protein
MLWDNTLSAMARTRSARQLAKICPARRSEVITALHEIRTVINPLHQIGVLAALGALNPEEATPLLQAMANDQKLNPVARLRAAEELADRRQDQCEVAALVARELMRDGNVPRHVRRHAACNLARWSLVCRQEARDMIIYTDSAHPRVDDEHASVVFDVD